MIYYKFAGLIANLVLIVNIILLMGALTMFNFVLTLPGIAGIILTIGLAVDASVLIYERLREELALGKSLKVALQTAYEKAFSSILDANVTTLITAAILFWKASGPVKGFAISLTLGILASLFTALIVGRNLFSWFVDTEKVKRISMLHLISSKHIDFLGKGFLAAMLSLALLIAGATAFVMRGDRNFGVDFKGGDLLSLSAAKTVQVAQIREALKPIHLDNEPIQQSIEGIVTSLPFALPSTRVSRSIARSRTHPQWAIQSGTGERVGALVGGELARNSLWALVSGFSES
jgi:SecD/SecF fusion protein